MHRHMHARRRSSLTEVLWKAAACGDEDTVIRIIRSGEKCIVHAIDDNGRNALHHAISGKQYAVANLLISEGARVDAQSIAAEMDHLPDSVALLLVKHCVHSASKGIVKLFHATTRNDRIRTLGWMLSNGVCSVNSRDRNRSTALHQASSTRCVTMLLNSKARVNAVDGNGDTPLHVAVRVGSIELVRSLLAATANPNFSNAHGSPLHTASELARADVVDELLRCGMDKDMPDLHSAPNMPLHYAASGGTTASDGKRVETALVLLESGANLNLHGRRGRSALQMAIAARNANVVLLLIEKGAHIHNSDLHLAIKETHTTPRYESQEQKCKVALALMTGTGLPSQRKNFFTVSRVQKPCLHVAMLQKEAELVRTLVSCGINLDTKDRSGISGTALHLAMFNGLFNIAHYLVSQGIDLDIQNDMGMTAMHIVPRKEVAITKSIAATKAILAHMQQFGANLDTCSALPGLRRVPLHLAIERSDERRTQAIIELGCSFLADERGFTAVHYAACYGSLALINVVLDFCTSQLAERDNAGMTALDHAILNKRSPVIVQRLRIALQQVNVSSIGIRPGSCLSSIAPCTDNETRPKYTNANSSSGQQATNPPRKGPPVLAVEKQRVALFQRPGRDLSPLLEAPWSSAHNPLCSLAQEPRKSTTQQDLEFVSEDTLVHEPILKWVSQSTTALEPQQRTNELSADVVLNSADVCMRQMGTEGASERPDRIGNQSEQVCSSTRTGDCQSGTIQPVSLRPRSLNLTCFSEGKVQESDKPSPNVSFRMMLSEQTESVKQAKEARTNPSHSNTSSMGRVRRFDEKLPGQPPLLLEAPQKAVATVLKKVTTSGTSGSAKDASAVCSMARSRVEQLQTPYGAPAWDENDPELSLIALGAEPLLDEQAPSPGAVCDIVCTSMQPSTSTLPQNHISSSACHASGQAELITEKPEEASGSSALNCTAEALLNRPLGKKTNRADFEAEPSKPTVQHIAKRQKRQARGTEIANGAVRMVSDRAEAEPPAIENACDDTTATASDRDQALYDELRRENLALNENLTQLEQLILEFSSAGDNLTSVGRSRGQQKRLRHLRNEKAVLHDRLRICAERLLLCEKKQWLCSTKK